MLKDHKFVIPNGVREGSTPGYAWTDERSLAPSGMTVTTVFGFLPSSTEEPV
jgi:hypothetical protein